MNVTPIIRAVLALLAEKPSDIHITSVPHFTETCLPGGEGRGAIEFVVNLKVLVDEDPHGIVEGRGKGMQEGNILRNGYLIAKTTDTPFPFIIPDDPFYTFFIGVRNAFIQCGTGTLDLRNLGLGILHPIEIVTPTDEKHSFPFCCMKEIHYDVHAGLRLIYNLDACLSDGEGEIGSLFVEGRSCCR
jgi:hypothetical protein